MQDFCQFPTKPKSCRGARSILMCAYICRQSNSFNIFEKLFRLFPFLISHSNIAASHHFRLIISYNELEVGCLINGVWIGDTLLCYSIQCVSEEQQWRLIKVREFLTLCEQIIKANSGNEMYKQKGKKTRQVKFVNNVYMREYISIEYLDWVH